MCITVGIFECDVETVLASQNDHPGMLAEKGNGAFNPGCSVEVVVVLQQGDVAAVGETDGFVVCNVFIQVVAADQKFVGSCQGSSKSLGVFQVGSVVDDNDFQAGILPQFGQDVTCLLYTSPSPRDS